MADKPLQVRVAEALGWKRCALELGVGLSGEKMWFGRPPEGSNYPLAEGDEPSWGYPLQHYPTDWSALGPLIHEHKIDLTWITEDICCAEARGVEGSNADPRIAVCHLILKLAEEGKL